MTKEVIGKLTVVVEGKEVGLSEALDRAEARMRRAAASVQASGASTAAGVDAAAAASGRLASAAELATNALGALGIAFGAAEIAQFTVQAVQAGASLQALESTFQQMTASISVSSERMLAAMRAASNGTISNADLMAAANKAILMGVARDVQEMEALIQIAMDRGAKMGMAPQKALDDLVTGLARGSPLILDNLGLTINLSEAYEQYAAAVGKSVQQLSEQEKKQALINAVMQQAQATMAQTGAAADDMATRLARLQASWDNVMASLQKWMAQRASPAVGFLQSGLSALEGNLATAIREYVNAYNEFSNASGVAREANLALAESLIQWLGLADQGAGAAGRVGGAFDAAGDATQKAAQALKEYTAELEQNAAKAALSAAQQEEAALAQQRLEAQARSAAQAVLAGGGDIAATAARLAASASLVDQLTAAYLRLALAQQQAANLATAKASLLATEKAGRSVDARMETAEDIERRVRAAQEYQRALRDQRLALAGPRERIELLKQERAQYAENSAEYVRLTTQILQAERALAQGRGRGGGAARLSDAQRYMQQREDLERKHQQTLTDIEARAMEQRRNAENAFRLSSLRGRAGFYASLASIEDAGLARSLSAAYEEAALKAQDIARTVGADAAKEYLAAAQQGIEAQARLQAEIAKAEKAGDAGRAEYLRGVLALQKAADEEQLRQIIEAGSAIEQARQRQYAEAEANYAAHLARMAQMAAKAPLAGASAARVGATPGGIPGATGAAPTGALASAPAEAARPMAVYDEAAVAAIREAAAAIEAATRAAGEMAAAAAQGTGRRIESLERAVEGLQTRFLR